MSELKNVHYDAFISYRHSELDSFVAKNIHTRLEAFRLPKSLRGKATDGKTRINRVFRDVDELPLSEDLSEPINTALANSDYLITICTPRYLESKWCMKEIEVFLQTHDRDHILVVLAEDEPYNSFPKILTYEEVTRADENGNTVTTQREIEPLAADTRGENKKEILKAMDVAIIKLCAAIFGLNFDDLKQRHREQKLRRMIAVFGSISAAILIFGIFATIMLIRIGKQNALISDQYLQLQDRYAGSMAGVADTLYGMGRRRDAVYTVRSVLPESTSEPVNAEALRVLYETMNVYGVPEKYVPVEIFEADAEITGFDVSPDGQYILVNDGLNLRVCDTETGEVVRKIKRSSVSEEYEDIYYFDACFCGNDAIIVVDGEDAYYTPIDERTREDIDGIGADVSFYPSPDGEFLLGYSDNCFYGYDAQGEQLYKIDMTEQFDGSYFYTENVEFDNSRILCHMSDGDNYYLFVAEKTTGNIIKRYAGEGSAMASKIFGNEIYISITTCGDETGEYDTVIDSVDYTKNEAHWTVNLKGMTPTDMELVGDYLYISDYNVLTVVDRHTGRILEMQPCGGEILCTWVEDEILYSFTADGKVRSWDGFSNGVDETDCFFLQRPEEELSKAILADDDLYVSVYRGNFVVRYAKEICEDAELSDEEYEDEFDFDPDDGAIEAIVEAFGKDAILPDYAAYSEDESYIAATYPDQTVRIYDVDTMGLLGSFTAGETDWGLTGFHFSKTMNCYVLNTYEITYLLNDHFEVFCRIPARLKEEGKDELLLRTTEWDYYSVPYVGYEELIERADAYLNGYEPSDEIRQRYGMQ